MYICDGCNVREPWEHRCFGTSSGCGCEECAEERLAFDTPRQYTEETGLGRVDRDGVEWFACDPYPTWYRWEGRKLITRERPNFNPLVTSPAEVEFPTPWKDGQITLKYPAGVDPDELRRRAEALVEEMRREADD